MDNQENIPNLVRIGSIIGRDVFVDLKGLDQPTKKAILDQLPKLWKSLTEVEQKVETFWSKLKSLFYARQDN